MAQTFRNKVFRASVAPNWFASGKRFWYRNDLENDRREFIVVDAAAGKRAPAFDHAKLAARADALDTSRTAVVAGLPTEPRAVTDRSP